MIEFNIVRFLTLLTRELLGDWRQQNVNHVLYYAVNTDCLTFSNTI